MKYTKGRRTLLEVAVVLVLSIGLSATNITYAAVDFFLKISGIEGEALQKEHKKWIAIEGKVHGTKLIIKK